MIKIKELFMKSNLLSLTAFAAMLVFLSCEDDEADAASSALDGTWTATALEYDKTCTGTSEETSSPSTFTFSGNQATMIESETFEDWCDGSITDGVCDEDGYTYEMSDFEEDCETSLVNGVCESSFSMNFTLDADSLYMNITQSLDLNEEFGTSYSEMFESLCTGELGGTYSDGICSFTSSMSFGLEIDGNTVTLTDVYIDDNQDEDSYCDIITLTKQ